MPKIDPSHSSQKSLLTGCGKIAGTVGREGASSLSPETQDEQGLERGMGGGCACVCVRMGTRLVWLVCAAAAAAVAVSWF